VSGWVAPSTVVISVWVSRVRWWEGSLASSRPGRRGQGHIAALLVGGQGDVMTVISVINYKGGVGKTTLTANIGSELASRGKTVLLIDLDPQASLTFSFYEADEWERSLADERTILQWYGSVLNQPSPEPLHEF